MDINLTLIVQMLVFLAFVWFTMKFVWPPLSKAMQERQDKIAAGLAAAERGHKALELAQLRVISELKQAKLDAAEIIEKANHRASSLINEAIEEAKLEAQQQIKLGQEQLLQETNRARDDLRKNLAELVTSGAEKILRREIDKHVNEELLHNLIKEL